jgi:tetratricopeptide (TPR) repeat protein
MKRVLSVAGSLAFSASLVAQTPAPTPAHDHAGAAAAPRPVTLYENLGSHRHPIATSSPEAQKFFDQGMILAFGFNHEEAYRFFERAAQLDPKAAMPHWGMALVLGANYNDPAPPEERSKKAHAELVKALELSTGSPENERAYVEALSKRYVADPASADKAKLERDYAAAMKSLTARYPDDLDAATMYAESLMNLHPWKLWTPDGQPGEDTGEIVSVLESVLKRDPTHPGANHYYIHATEASKSPEKALPSAKRLETLVPSAGHLVHMPAHVYIRTGEYVAAEKANAIAADVDREYIRRTGGEGMYPLMYYTHNVHFESAAASLAGRHASARRAADALAAEVTPAVSQMPTMLEAFLLQPVFVAVRFQNWEDLRAMPDPGAKMPLVRAGWLWGRAMAAAGQRDAARARTLRDAYGVAKDAVPKDYLSSPQNSAAALFAVSDAVLDGRISEAAGDRKAAIEAFRRAVAAEDALAYDEPPAWYYPTRESLGGTLLRDGRPDEAEKVFRDDLAKHPRNPRSLFGLTASLEAQKKTADAAWTRAQFETAWKDADTKLSVEGL